MDKRLMRNRCGNGHGVRLETREGASLDSLNKDTLLETLADAGYLLLRGFRTDLGGFSRFVQRMSCRVSLDPARKFHGGEVAQKVDAGFDALGLHCENGNTPFQPDLCWFFCEKAAREGSQTTVCDGYRVWEALSPSTRERFLAEPIQYSRHVDTPRWKSFVFHSLQGRKPMEQLEIGDLVELVRDRDSTTLELNPDGSIAYFFRVPAAHRTLFSERLAFANSILGPSVHYEKPRISFASGAPIPDEVLAEVSRVTEALTEELDWRDGDVALIDNSRVMHGRRAILDPSRSIYNALSYLR